MDKHYYRRWLSISQLGYLCQNRYRGKPTWQGKCVVTQPRYLERASYRNSSHSIAYCLATGDHCLQVFLYSQPSVSCDNGLRKLDQRLNCSTTARGQVVGTGVSAMGYRHYATATRAAILRTWSLEGDFPIDSCISLSWINSFPDMSIGWETFFKVWIGDTINEKKGISMIVHLDRELFHNKLLHKTLGCPLFRTWSPA